MGRWYGALASHPAFNGHRLGCPFCTETFTAEKPFDEHLTGHPGFTDAVAHQYMSARSYDRLHGIKREARKKRAILGPIVERLDDSATP